MANKLLLLLILTPPSSCQLLPLTESSAIKESLVQCVINASRKYFPKEAIITISMPPVFDLVQDSVPLEDHLFGQFFKMSEWTVLATMPTLPMIGLPLWGGNRHRAANFTGAMINENSTIADIVAALKTRPARNPKRFAVVKSNAYIIIIKDPSDLKPDLEGIVKHPSWNPMAQFMVISGRTYENAFDVMWDVIRKLWDMHVLNGVLMFPSDKPDEFDVISWYPYANGMCGYNIKTYYKISSCYFGQISNQVDWFMDKIPQNLNGCIVRVHTMSYPPFVIPPEILLPGKTDIYRLQKGIEVQLMNLVAEIAGFKVEYALSGKETDWMFIRRGKIGTGILSDVYNGTADIALASLPLVEENANNLDASSDYIQDSLTFCVPHAQEKSHGQKMYEVITPQVWIACFLTQFLIMYLIHTYSTQLSNGSEALAFGDYGNLFIKMLSISIGCAINQQPRTSRVRYILMMWVILSIYTVAGFQTYLMSHLTQPAYETQITTFEGIVEANLQVLIQKSSLKFFFGSSIDGSVDTILSRSEFCNNLEKCFHRTAHQKDSAVIASTLYSTFAKDMYKSNNNMPLLYCFKDIIVTFPIVMYMQKGYPLRKRFNRIISNIVNSGYVDWWARSLYESKKLTFARLDEAITSGNKLLKFKHVKPVIILYLIGVFIASVAFVGELIFNRISLYVEKEKLFKKKSIKI